MLTDGRVLPYDPKGSAGHSSDRSALDNKTLARCIRHLIHDELRKEGAESEVTGSARSLVVPSHGACPDEQIRLGADGIGLDSLSTISAATAVSRFFDLGASGLDDYLLFEDTIAGWAALVARHFAILGDDVHISFQTSGSTDRPTLVRKTLVDLFSEVDALASTILPRTARRVVALPPPQHIFGFIFTVLLPYRMGLPVADGVFRGAGSTMHALAEGDVIVGTPFNWATLLATGRRFPPDVHGMSSAGPMPPGLWGELAEAGLADLCEIFGSTETGGIGWRGCEGTPFALLPHVQRSGDILRSRATGAQLPLQDHLDWQGEHWCVPKGRIDRAVQIAGVNVSLDMIRKALYASDHVAEAAVRPDSGRLKAFVVPSDPSIAPDALRLALDAHARMTLDAVARPMRYTFGPSLPRNAMGKLADW